MFRYGYFWYELDHLIDLYRRYSFTVYCSIYFRSNKLRGTWLSICSFVCRLYWNHLIHYNYQSKTNISYNYLLFLRSVFNYLRDFCGNEDNLTAIFFDRNNNNDRVPASSLRVQLFFLISIIHFKSINWKHFCVFECSEKVLCTY